MDSGALGAELGEVLQEVPLAAVVLDFEGRVLLWNPAAERLFGWTAAESLGQLAPHVPEERREEAVSSLQGAREVKLDGVRRQRIRKDGRRIEVRMWSSRVRDASGAVTAIVAWFVDETALHQHELELEKKTRRVQLLQEIAVAANESDALEPALRRALSSVCEHLGCPLGHAFLVEERTGLLRPTGLWSLYGADRYELFRRATESRHLPAGSGLPGLALGERRPVWMEDASANPHFLRAELARQCGLRAGFAIPILSHDEVVAVMEFFCEDARPPDPGLLEVMFHLGTQLGRVVERLRAEQERAELAERARRATEEAAHARTDKALAMLSTRERDVLRYVSLGADNLKIAALLGISERTVKAHLTSILTKLGLENRTQAARFAWTAGLEVREDASM